MGWRLPVQLSRWISVLKSKENPPDAVAPPSEGDESQSDAYLTPINPGLSPSPQELISKRVIYEVPLLRRRINRDEDVPLAALYRAYEHLVLDQHIQLRNEIEAFWWHSDWAVCEIPDPRSKDSEPERLACLACITKLLCLAFNKRIEMGLPRDAPPIFTRDMLDEWRAQERRLEKEPVWASEISPLKETLAIPHWDNGKREFVPLASLKDDKASPECASMNVLIWRPHVHFA